MRGQLLSLRLISSSSARLYSSSPTSIVSRACKLRYPWFFPKTPPPLVPPPRFLTCNVGIRAFSSRSMGSRTGGRDNRPGEFRASSVRGLGKSLIEDEAELSDWVSDLKTDSFNIGLSSDNDSSDDRVRSRSKDRDRDRDRVGEHRSGDRGSLRSMRGQHNVSVSDRRQPPSSIRSGRNPRAPHSRNLYGSDLDDDNDDEADFTSRSKGRGPRGGFSSGVARGGRSNPNLSRPGQGFDKKIQAFETSEEDEADDNDDDEVDFSSRRSKGRGARGGFSSGVARGGRINPNLSRPGQGFDKKIQAFETSEEEEVDDSDDDEVDFSSRRSKGQGGRGGFSSAVTRGGRSGPNLNLPRRVLDEKIPAFETSEEEEVDDDDDDISSFEDGLSAGEDGEGVLKDSFKTASSSPEQEGDSSQPEQRMPLEQTNSYLSQTRFDQCSLSPFSLKGIKTAGYERMTVVQEATLPVILKGKDVLAKAKTGTGKTVAFLLPAIEAVTKLPPVDRDQRRPPINVLVICPTRELASQAATEANTLLKFHPAIGVQVVIGGTRLALEQKRMQANPCQILVATPGRLRDHIENTPGFATRLMGVKVLVLDEADHLLDMGFRKDIEKIVAAVPKQRQTLLFSATVPEEVRQICYIALKRDHEFINTVEEGTEETHSQVSQMVLLVPLEKHFSTLYALLTEHISENADYKVLVFCTTAMGTKLIADLLSELNLNVREIHSRKPQSYRTRVSEEFRKSKGLILVTSDVSARGVDYPDVTLVVQVGVPSEREHYIHRLGRTGRKGKEGKGILLLAPWEDFFLGSIKDLPVIKAELPPVDPDTRKKVERALSHVEMKNKESAYQAWLGYYNSNKNVGRDKGRLVALANEFSRSMGLDNPPAIPKLVLGKMGLRNIPGLRAK